MARSLSIAGFVAGALFLGACGGEYKTASLFPQPKDKAPIEETLVLNSSKDFNPNDWKIRSSRLSEGRMVVEWMKKDENPKQWSELIVLQYYPQKSSGFNNPQHAVATLKDSLLRQHWDMDWKILSNGEREVWLEWSCNNFCNRGDRAELSRTLQGKKGVHRLAFLTKGKRIRPEKKAQVLRILSAAQLQTAPNIR